MSGPRIGIDLGGTKTEAALLSPTGEVAWRRRQPTPVAEGPEGIIGGIASLVEAARSESVRLGWSSASPPPVGIGTPGSLSSVTGLLRNSNTTCLNGLPLRQMLEARLQQAVVLENDANCFALAEALQGAGQGHRLVFGVILGTGCGGGIVMEGRLWAGPSRVAGEWGHHRLDPMGPACWCGQRGCVETLISGSGLQARYRSETGLERSAEAILHDELDPVSLRLREEFFVHLGQGLAQVVGLLDPDVIVMGGGLSGYLPLYQWGAEEVRSRVFGGEWRGAMLRNRLGDSAGVIGAAWLGAPA